MARSRVRSCPCDISSERKHTRSPARSAAVTRSVAGTVGLAIDGLALRLGELGGCEGVPLGGTRSPTDRPGLPEVLVRAEERGSLLHVLRADVAGRATVGSVPLNAGMQ